MARAILLMWMHSEPSFVFSNTSFVFPEICVSHGGLRSSVLEMSDIMLLDLSPLFFGNFRLRAFILRAGLTSLEFYTLTVNAFAPIR